MELTKPLLHLEMFSTPNRLLDDLIKESIEAKLSSLEKLLKEAQLPVIRITCYKYNRLEANCLIALSQILDLFLYTHIRKVLERKAMVISLPLTISKRCLSDCVIFTFLLPMKIVCRKHCPNPEKEMSLSTKGIR